ncbi:dual specificity protein phosphatase 3 isoform X2 [Athalia rosae]|uniref:dual specificity protein phosphatase 3 isoform X2 n=1 Tax=Athalia rosae TaxID=37344 RepID=UPI00203465B9|nr:dual specificity protein phosphatase 3 isoform X2 [Athalia rosae]
MESTWRDRDRDFQKHLIDGETTIQDLVEVLHDTKTNFQLLLPGFTDEDDSTIWRNQKDIDCDEVYENIYIGDAATAKNKEYLKKLGITHVLNAAEGKRFGFVDTDKNYYKDTTIKYLGLPLADRPWICIRKVFVHCMMGISRSATCVLAYLMIKKQLLAAEAVTIVRQNRDIYPNEGFLHQLAQLDNQLRRQRL